MSAYDDAVAYAEAKITAAASSLKSWFSSGAGWFSHSNGYDYNSDFGSQLSQSELFAMTADEWEDFYVNNASLWSKLPSQVRDYAEAVMDAGEDLEELEEILKEALAGFSYDDAVSGLQELVTAADLAFSDISDSFALHMEDAILAVVTSNADERLAAWYESVAEAMADGALTNAEREALQAEYEDIVSDAAADYEAMKELAGITDSSDPDTSLSGAISTASQESIDLLAGQTNAIRVNQVLGLDLMREQLVYLASIDGKIGISNGHLSDISTGISSLVSSSSKSSSELRGLGVTDY